MARGAAPEVVYPGGALLGEGPHWDAASGCLLWVDIPRGLIHRFDPTRGRDDVVEMDDPSGQSCLACEGAGWPPAGSASVPWTRIPEI